MGWIRQGRGGTGVRPLLLAILAGFLYALAYPPLSGPGFAWLALALLFASLAGRTPRFAFLLGGLFSAVAALGVTRFLPGMAAGFLKLPPAAGWALLAAAVAPVVPLYGVYASWIAWLARRGRATPLLAGAGWAGCEYVRTALALPGGWALLAYAEPPGSSWLQTADLGGPYLPGLVMAAVGFGLAAAVRPALRGRRFALGAAALGAATVLTFAYGTWRLGQDPASGEPVVVAMVQDGFAGYARWDEATRGERLDRIAALTREAAAAAPAAIFWPESSVDFYLREDTPERERVLAIARESGADLFLGGPHYRVGEDGPRYFNSIFLIHAGRFAGRYDKHRLLPVAETSAFSAGPAPAPLASDAFSVGFFVCSEALHPDLARRLAAAGAEVLANPSNDSWFPAASAGELQLRTAALRAIETRRFLIRPTPTGQSAIVDPEGRIAARAPGGEPAVLVGSVRASHVATLYQRAGDAATWTAMAWAVAASYVCWRSGGRGARGEGARDTVEGTP
jgi:apolipoprotein N-acyltransferase